MNTSAVYRWAAGVVIAVIFVGVLWISLRPGANRASEAPTRIELLVEVDSLRDVLQRRDSLFEPATGLQEWEVRRLQRRGLADPAPQLVDSLMKRSDLIPYEGAVGGRMSFRREGTRILTDRWVLAAFDDGHIAGHMILRYEVTSGGRVSWEVIDGYQQ